MDHNKLGKILQEMGVPDHLTCLLRNLYAGQKALTVRTGHGATHWFQIIARRAFLNGQCIEIGENNRMGKTRDLIKKIRDIKGTFHAKIGTIKDRNGMDLTEAEVIKKR